MDVEALREDADFGAVHVATGDVTMRERLRHISTIYRNVSALDVLDALVALIGETRSPAAIADRLAARLRVHATDAATGYRQDPLSINDPDAPEFPGMSDRWCLLDQYALADYEAALSDGQEAPNA